MAGETIKTEAICLDIRPWSQTSHVVSWLTPNGKVATVVKGAVRPKSAFLGQYDLNYTCEILYYARARAELHALREATPLRLRERLRGDWRMSALADYFRLLAAELAPVGSECAAWFGLLERTLDGLSDDSVRELVAYELSVLSLAGLAPDFSGYDRSAEWSSFGVEAGSFASADGGRQIRVPRAVAAFLNEPSAPATASACADAARVLGVFCQFHLDCATDIRRTVLRLVSRPESGA